MKDIHALVESRAKWIMGAREKMQLVPPSVMDVGTAVDYAKYKYVALKLVLDRIAFWNAQLGLFYRAVTIRDMRSRWGSCSRDGRLAFTYRLALLPQELVDYVVVHELCHLIVFDHSPAFWKKVESCLPNYRQLKLLLKRS
jgi:predicted metal-dependent hydrolase